MNVVKLERKCEECGKLENLYVLIVSNSKVIILCKECMNELGENINRRIFLNF